MSSPQVVVVLLKIANHRRKALDDGLRVWFRRQMTTTLVV